MLKGLQVVASDASVAEDVTAKGPAGAATGVVGCVGAGDVVGVEVAAALGEENDTFGVGEGRKGR